MTTSTLTRNVTYAYVITTEDAARHGTEPSQDVLLQENAIEDGGGCTYLGEDVYRESGELVDTEAVREWLVGNGYEVLAIWSGYQTIAVLA